MIEQITLENIKSHRRTCLELRPLTVLVGPNAAGKSSVLEALRVACWGDGMGLEAMVRYGSDRPPKVELLGEVNGRKWQYSGDPSARGLSSFRAPILAPSTPEGWRHGAIHLQFVAQNLATPWYSGETIPRLEMDGHGLASVIGHWMTSDPERVQTLTDEVRRILPFVERLRVRRAKIRRSERRVLRLDDKSVPLDEEREVIGEELIFDTVGGKELPASAMSEGTLMIVGLLTALYTSDSPGLVLLDDIEKGLHPKAQRDLVRTLRRLVDERPGLQIVMTSHSPYVVDEMEADEVWVLTLDPEGCTRARCLADHPDAERALDLLTTGEFWSAEGEGWVETLPASEEANA